MDNEPINHESTISTVRLNICIGHLIYRPMISRIKAMLATKLFFEIQAPLSSIYTNSMNKFSLISSLEIKFITSNSQLKKNIYVSHISLPICLHDSSSILWILQMVLKHIKLE